MVPRWAAIAGAAYALLAFGGLFVDPEPAEAQGCLLRPLDCAPDDPIGDIVDPVIDGIRDAAGRLVEGSLDFIGATIAEAAISALNFLWSVLDRLTQVELGAVQSVHNVTAGVALSFLAGAVIAGWIPAFAKRDLLRTGITAARGGVAGILILATRPIMEAMFPMLNAITDYFIDSAHDELGVWIAEIGGPVALGIGVINWFWLVLVGLVFIIGVMAIMAVLIGATLGIYGAYVFSPFAIVAWVPDQTRDIAQAAIRRAVGYLLIRPATAIMIAITTSLLAYSAEVLPDDPVAAMSTMMMAGVWFLGVAFANSTLMGIVGGPTVRAVVAEARAVGQSAYKPIEAAAGVATVAATVTGAGYLKGAAARTAASASSSTGSASGNDGTSGDTTHRHYHEVVNGPSTGPGGSRMGGGGSSGEGSTARPADETTGRRVDDLGRGNRAVGKGRPALGTGDS